MAHVKNLRIDVKRLMPEDGKSYFFGYYDVPAFSRNGKYHLCHRVDFWKRFPTESDVAELGMVEMESGIFRKFAETTAWHFQQGSMLQWHPKAPDDEVIFNIREDSQYKGAIVNVHTLEKRILERPIANVDPMGKYALSINFSRLFDYRPGYGYTGIKDPFFNNNHPPDDGIFLVDLETGKARLIISLEQIWEKTKVCLAGEDKKILVNHITFNADGTRFVFLARYFNAGGGQLKTAILTANTDGTDMFVLSEYAYASHYYWKNSDEILFHSDGKEVGYEGPQLYLLKDKTHKGIIMDRKFFLKDGHMSYSPDREWILYDSYPDEENFRHLYLYNEALKKGILLGSFYHDPCIHGEMNDIRCDLHPRWRSDGKGISFDSIHEGQRYIYYSDITSIMHTYKVQ